MKFLAFLLFGAGLSQSQTILEPFHALILDGPEKWALPMCTHDNLYRIFLDNRYSSSASAFCSNYITSTGVSTTVAKATATSYTSVTDATSTVTTVVLVTPITADSALTVAPKAKLQGVPAAFAPGKVGTYPPNRISSACSCLVSPLVLVRQLAIDTSTSTQIWTRHFTRLTTTIETTTSTPNIAAASSSVIPIDSAPTTSVAAASTDGAAQSSSAIPSDAAPTTSFAAASTTANAAAASTSTVDTTPLAAYCSGGDIYIAQTYTPQCGFSYIPETPDPSTINTVDSYISCAMICDLYECNVYSYLLTAAEDNCYVFYYGQNSAPYADPNVDSGAVDFF